MALFNFKRQFAHAVTAGTKRQTIRAPRKDGTRPKPGETLHLYTGLRTKGADLLARYPCKSVHNIQIRQHLAGPHELDAVPLVEVVLDGRRLTRLEVHELAIADGFPTAEELLAFFLKEHGGDFEGILVKW